jgi:ATP-binding protein involved in chromosome partitioning
MDLKSTITIHAHKVANYLKPLPNVKNVIAIASGKGGVGKSSTSVNLALTLAKLGLKIGILDADVYGPSIPAMLGLTATPEVSAENKFIPLIAQNNIQVISIACLIQKNQPAIWRGPMASSALQQLFNQTKWQQLDYLIVDLPPGTGDIQLTLVQKIPLTAAIIVTTPQDIALLDAQKALTMFNKLDIPVLGIVENMAEYVCNKCGHGEHIFGQDGGKKLANNNITELLGSVPLDISICLNLDKGEPNQIFTSQTISNRYLEIANKINLNLAKLPRNQDMLINKVLVNNE